MVRRRDDAASLPYITTPMPKLTFYPLGNADSCLVALDHKFMLFDFADMHDPLANDERRINLPEAVRDDIGWPNRKHIDVVAFTHIDNDHVKGSGEFFHLDHAACYQGEDRVKITEMWVPAAAIVEEGAEDDGRIIRQEARHRLREGKGILVFSRPERLKEWFRKEGIDFDSRAHLIVDAGRLVPTVSQAIDGVEFFVHSPFGERDGTVVLDRNENSLVFQATFSTGNTRLLLAADTTHEIWDKIVWISHLHRNDDRLKWDIYKLPHHCSYTALSPEKGTTVTTPTKNVDWLVRTQGNRGGYVVSTSWPIDHEDQSQPPHFQAKNYYVGVLKEKAGAFKVTMEHPNRVSPARLVIDITPGGARLATAATVGASAIVSSNAPRNG